MRKRSRCFFAPLAPVLEAPRLEALGLLMLAPALLTCSAQAQNHPEASTPKWDFSVFAAGATGEENTNAFSEAQILVAGVLVGRSTREMGRSWLRGRFEYAADFIPLFVQFAPHRISGTAFDPIILRWNLSFDRRVSPFAELGGGGLHTRLNFPAGDSSTFNFIARGGGGILIATRHGQAIELACRWWHISNA